eukprot:364568-Chlamydomonas_euryale.AAC.11
MPDADGDVGEAAKTQDMSLQLVCKPPRPRHRWHGTHAAAPAEVSWKDCGRMRCEDGCWPRQRRVARRAVGARMHSRIGSLLKTTTLHGAVAGSCAVAAAVDLRDVARGAWTLRLAEGRRRWPIEDWLPSVDFENAPPGEGTSLRDLADPPAWHCTWPRTALRLPFSIRASSRAPSLCLPTAHVLTARLAHAPRRAACVATGLLEVGAAAEGEGALAAHEAGRRLQKTTVGKSRGR